MQNYGFKICEKESKDQQCDEQTIQNCHCMRDFFLILHSAFSISINLTCCWVLLIILHMHLLSFFPLLSEDPVCCSLSTSVCPPPPQKKKMVNLFFLLGWGGAEKDVQRLHVLLFKRFSQKIVATLQNYKCEDLKFEKVVMLKTSVDLL